MSDCKLDHRTGLVPSLALAEFADLIGRSGDWDVPLLAGADINGLKSVQGTGHKIWYGP